MLKPGDRVRTINHIPDDKARHCSFIFPMVDQLDKMGTIVQRENGVYQVRVDNESVQWFWSATWLLPVNVDEVNGLNETMRVLKGEQ